MGHTRPNLTLIGTEWFRPRTVTHLDPRDHDGRVMVTDHRYQPVGVWWSMTYYVTPDEARQMSARWLAIADETQAVVDEHATRAAVAS